MKTTLQLLLLALALTLPAVGQVTNPTQEDFRMPRGDARELRFTTDTDIAGDSVIFTVALGWQSARNFSTTAVIRKANRYALGGDDEQVFSIDSTYGYLAVYLPRSATVNLSEKQYYYTLYVNDTMKYYGNITILPSMISATVGGSVDASRLISTTAPLMGGGNLTADRTFYIHPDTLRKYEKDTSGAAAIAALEGDVATNASGLAGHVGNTSNPHSVTAAQLGALTPTDTAGWNRSNEVTALEGDVATNASGIASHVGNTSNPHSVTAAQLGALTPTDTAGWNRSNEVTALEGDVATNASGLSSHVGNTSNPHSVTAAQVGSPPTTRSISTTSPLTGGGDLSADRTLSISTVGASTGDVLTFNGSAWAPAAAAGGSGDTSAIHVADTIGVRVWTGDTLRFVVTEIGLPIRMPDWQQTTAYDSQKRVGWIKMSAIIGGYILRTTTSPAQFAFISDSVNNVALRYVEIVHRDIEATALGAGNRCVEWLSFALGGTEWQVQQDCVWGLGQEVRFQPLLPYTRNQMHLLATSAGENVTWSRLEIEIGFVINQGAASTWYVRPVGL